MPRLTKLQREHNQERVNRASDIIEGYQESCRWANRLNFEGELATARNYFDDEHSGRA